MEPSRSRRVLAIAALGVFVLAGSLGLLAVSLSADAGQSANATRVASVDPNVSTVHAAGITGENVTVGVVDVTGFDADASALDGRVADARAFESGGSIDDDTTDHGTAAAETVARVAPDADLYLATFDSPEGYERAVEWLVAEDVDVVVAPASFYGTPGDGTSRVAEVAANATEAGVVFVAPSGNLARGHWAGRYRTVENGVLSFGGNARNYLRGDDRDVTVWLSWDDAGRGTDYTAELYWTDGDDTRLVARSRPYAGDDVPNERIVARVQSGTYFVTVTGPANATDARLRLSSPTHRFQHLRPNGSVVAPASAPAAVSVGAYDGRLDRVEPFSSRGPTPDGRAGVDVVAPSRPGVADVEGFVGSSAASAYAGGVSALVLDANPGLSPAQVERRLEATALGADEGGVDPAAGHGRVAPERAVGGAANATG
ncbi:S8 family serine peptidase [Halorussus halobius]|uniref:S8 family serine peptidase n=1 Tax=Halorussus halobius TaxID=1710537 RepID=UPI00109298AD|nr:S8 family serine peptidase [Halorussus halobius]